MSDNNSIDSWKPKFAEWIQASTPLFQEGKGKEAFASYPWFTTEGDPFTKLGKPASEARFSLIATGGYSIEGSQEPFAPIPSFDGSPRRWCMNPTAARKPALPH